MADWTVVAELGTAVGTLVLAAATFASVRSANRSARAAERSTLEAMRPLLLPSRLDDADEKVGFVDDRWLRVSGGHAVAEYTDDAIYLAVSVRNVGRGLAVLNAWQIVPERQAGHTEQPDQDTFRRLTIDLYVAPGAQGHWQGALRDPDEAVFTEVVEAIEKRTPMTIDVLYGDGEGGQRVITRLLLSPLPDDDHDLITSAVHHWNLDRADPR